MGKLGGLDSGTAAQMESMKVMMGTASLINLVVYGGAGVLMIVVATGCLLFKRWARPFTLTLGWGWLYMGVVMMASLALIIGPMKEIMDDAIKTQLASAPEGTLPASMDTFISLFIVLYLGFIFVFLVLVPGILIWLNWNQDVRHTFESRDLKTRWTDRRPVPIIGLVICSITFAVFSLPGLLMMNQPWMSHLSKMMTLMFSPKRMGVLMGVSMLPVIGYLLWVVRFFRSGAV